LFSPHNLGTACRSPLVLTYCLMHVSSCLQKQGQLRTIVHCLLKQLCLEDAWNVILTQLRLSSRGMYEAAHQQSSLSKEIEAELARDVQAIGIPIMNFLSWHVVRPPAPVDCMMITRLGLACSTVAAYLHHSYPLQHTSSIRV
jgi:hypothetical protein